MTKPNDRGKISDLICIYGLPGFLDLVSTLCDNQADMLRRCDADPKFVRIWQKAAANLHHASHEAEYTP